MVTQSDQDFSPATPLEWARLYEEYTERLDAASVNTLVSAQFTLIWPGNKPQTTYTKAEQLETLGAMYHAEKAAGTTIRAADCTITQLARDFAMIKFTWATQKPGSDAPVHAPVHARVMYTLRLEEGGWRLVYCAELGANI